MLVPGVALTVLPAVAAGGGSLSARLVSSVPGLVALGWPVWFTLDLARRDTRETRLRSRSDVLDPVRRPRAPEMRLSVLALLEADGHTSCFYSRESQLRELTRWLESDMPVVIVGGPAQSGKKRLAIEWAEHLPPGWIAGWARAGRGGEIVDRLVPCRQNTVVLVHGFPQDLPLLLDRVRRHGAMTPRVRVLVASRDADGLRDRLRRVPTSAPLAEAPEVHVDSIGARSDHERWYREQCRYYAAQRTPPVPTVNLPALPRWEAPPIGLIHAAALAAVLQRPSSRARRLDFGEVLATLWISEIGSWSESRRDDQWALSALSDRQIEAGVLAVSMLSPEADQLVGVLQRVPDLAATDVGVLRNLARWAQDMYPARGESVLAVELRPHLIADAAFQRLATEDRGFARSVLETPVDGHAFALITRLVRAVPLFSIPSGWMGLAVAGRPDRLFHAVEQALLSAPTDGHLDRELADAVDALADSRRKRPHSCWN
jgi:hypothetical protein